jgi:Inosine-uridine preferring nucleoside hydrolase
VALLLGCTGVCRAEPPPKEKMPIILDCDIGTDIDDTFALALALLSPELDLRGVTTVSGNTITPWPAPQCAVAC